MSKPLSRRQVQLRIYRRNPTLMAIVVFEVLAWLGVAVTAYWTFG